MLKKETKTAWILAKIKTRGFVEAKNINQLAKDLQEKAENLRHIITFIEINEQGNHNYQDYFFEKKGTVLSFVIIYVVFLLKQNETHYEQAKHLPRDASG